MRWTIGILGGSGLYAIPGLKDAEWRTVDSAWGTPSDQILHGTLGGVGIRFLPRHGRGHRIPPDAVDARANIDALKRAGATDILAVSSVGSLREELPPGRFVVVDQFIDRTTGRVASFFGTGLVGHVSLADPVCPRLSSLAARAAEAAGAAVTLGGTYLAMQGPQFSTRAESRLYRAWGADVIGMTAMPEAKLAREAALPYALVGMVTDYDSWREAEAGVDVAAIVAQMQGNVAVARDMVAAYARLLPDTRAPSPIDRALDGAVLTAPSAREPELVERIDALARRRLD
ncbi:5'-methylthioadenosine phosphorylase [Sphingomonas gellani]|nr:5'-methylthioadenosine phosphorylase [Sphingomonas gellani]